MLKGTETRDNGLEAGRFLMRRAPRGGLVLVVVLMVLTALTEGLGIILLAPMLTLLDGEVPAGGVAGALAALGLPLDLASLLAVFVALVLLRGLLLAWRSIAGLALESALVDDLRDRLYRAVLAAPWRLTVGMRQTDHLSLMISRVDMAGYCFNRLLALAASTVALAGAAATAFYLSPRLAAVGVVGGLLVLAAFSRFRQRARSLGVALGEAYDAIHGEMQRGLSALRLIKMLGREERSAREARGVFARLRAAQLGHERALQAGQILLQTGAALALAVVVWLAVEHWRTDPAYLLPLVALTARAAPLLSALVAAWQDCAHAAPSVHAVRRMLDELEPHAEPAAPPDAPPPLARELRLDGVTLRHAGRLRPALDQVSLAIPARAITALSGRSGAGKSTLADLAAGLIAPDAGAVLLDGAPLDEAARPAWRKAVAYVQQEPVLFNGTIRQNLAWAQPEASEAAMIAALEDASAGFVLDLPDGLDTLTGDSGRQLSGGERQRIVLARALLRQPTLLILDEAASSLDSASERAIAEAIARLRGRMTIIVIGHRGALAALADQRVTLAEGRVKSVDGLS